MRILSMILAMVFTLTLGCTNPESSPDLNNPFDPYAAGFTASGPLLDQPFIWGENVKVTWQRKDFHSQENQVQRKVHQDSSFVVISTVSGGTVTVFDYGPFKSGATYYYRVVSTSVNGKQYPSNTVSILLP